MATKISLEDYLEFLQSPDYSNPSIDTLNQIIFMHGFRKLYTAKRKVSNAAECVDLIDPSRSTLTSTITPTASITLEDCVAHLDALHWQECCVTSIHNFPLAIEAQKRNLKRKSPPETITQDEAGGTSSSALMSLGSC